MVVVQKRINLQGVMMNLLEQAYYTSCEKGISGYSGYQTRAISTDLGSDDVQFLEKYCFYPQSYDMPPEPSAEQIHQLPIVYKFVSLYSGHHAMIRVSYLGRDYSGRWGNYIAHSVVAKTTKFWLVDGLFWNGWKGEFSDTESSSLPEKLPQLSVSAITFSTDTWNLMVTRFLSQKDHKSILVGMIAAIFAYQQDGRSIVIRGVEIPSINLWISILHKSFPQRLQGQLSFCNYVIDPMSCHVINGTVGQSKFTFSSTEKQYQYYVFDFVEWEFASFPVEQTTYGSLVAQLFSDITVLQAFHDFSLFYPKDIVDTDLVTWMQLFFLYKGFEQDIMVLDNILVFLDTHKECLPIDVQTGVFLSIGKILIKHIQRPFSERIQLLEMLLKFPVIDALKYHRSLTFFWIRLLSDMAQAGQQTRDIVALRDKIPNIQSIINSDVCQEYILGIVQQKNPHTMRSILEQVQYFDQSGAFNAIIQWVLEHISVSWMSAKKDRQEYIQIFFVFCRQIDDIYQQAKHLHEKVKQNITLPQEQMDIVLDIARVLESIIHQKWEPDRWTFYQKLYADSNLSDIAKCVFIIGIDNSSRKQLFFQNFQQHVLSIVDISQTEKCQLYQKYFTKISPTEQKEQAMIWLDKQDNILGCSDMREAILTIIETSMSLKIHDEFSKKYAQMVAGNTSVFPKTPPNIRRRYYLDQALEPDSVYTFVETLCLDIRGVEQFVREGLFGWVDVLAKKNPSEFCLGVLERFQQVPLFIQELENTVRARIHPSFTKIDVVLMLFCLKQELQAPIAIFEKRAQQMPKELWEQTKQQLLQEARSTYLLQRVQESCARIEEDRLSFLDKAKRIFEKFFSKQ